MREFIMSNDQLDDGSLVVNFDMQDDGTIVNTGGYVQVRQEDKGFYIVIFDGQGNNISDVFMPYSQAFNGDVPYV